MADCLITFTKLCLTENDNTDIVGLQVESHALEARAELNHLFGLDVLEAIDTSDTITNGQDTTGLIEVSLGSGAQDPLLQDGGHFCGGCASLNSAGGGQFLGQDTHGSSNLKEAIMIRTFPAKFYRVFRG